MRYYQAVEIDFCVFYQPNAQQGGNKKANRLFIGLREEQLAGLVPSHINSLTGENVFKYVLCRPLAMATWLIWLRNIARERLPSVYAFIL